jgi:uncharacterized protein YecE (DUF72 family)
VPVLVGTSGWQYRHWRGRFYPRALPQRAWLEHYASRFATVESNNAFYRLPEPGTFADWARRTPDDFVMAVKASRFLRFHQGRATPRPCYGRAALASWSARLADLWGPAATVYAFFNNDPAGCAVRDARRFALATARSGLSPTRVPSASEAPAG